MEWTLVLPKKTCATKHSKKYVPFVTRGRCSQKQKWRTVQNINSVSTENEIFKRNQSSKKDDRKREAQGPHHNQRCSEMTFLCAVWLIWERRTEISRVYGLEWLKRVCCELRWGIVRDSSYSVITRTLTLTTRHREQLWDRSLGNLQDFWMGTNRYNLNEPGSVEPQLAL